MGETHAFPLREDDVGARQGLLARLESGLTPPAQP